MRVYGLVGVESVVFVGVLIPPQKNSLLGLFFAGPEGIEPPIEVLETSVIPFNYGPLRIALVYQARVVFGNLVRSNLGGWSEA